MPKEAKARILINDLLQRSGWRFFDDETGPANIFARSTRQAPGRMKRTELIKRIGEIGTR